METRRCSKCGETKPVDDFMWHRKAQGKRDCYCRPCRAAYKRQHYLANKQRYIDQAAQSRHDTSTARVRFLVDYFRTHPCVDCGENDPVVLDFDHLRDKSFTIANGLNRRWAELLAEIEKCEVVCGNCHRRRTIRRGGFPKAALLPDAPRGSRVRFRLDQSWRKPRAA